MTGSETGKPEMISEEMLDRAARAYCSERFHQPCSHEIGALDRQQMRAALAAVAEELAERGARAERERLLGAGTPHLLPNNRKPGDTEAGFPS